MLDLCFFSQTREAIRAAPEGRRGLAVAKSRHRPVGKPDIAGLWLSVECDGLINDRWPFLIVAGRLVEGGRYESDSEQQPTPSPKDKASKHRLRS